MTNRQILFNHLRSLNYELVESYSDWYLKYKRKNHVVEIVGSNNILVVTDIVNVEHRDVTTSYTINKKEDLEELGVKVES